MRRFEIPLPIPGQGLNCIDDSLILDNEAAEGTKNISFKNSIPQTRKGYIKASPFNFTTEPHTLYNYKKGTTKYLLAACGSVLKKQNGDIFDDITGALNTDYIELLTYPYKFADPDIYSDKCFILDGNSYRYYDGGAALADVPAYTPTQKEIDAYGTNVLSTHPDEIKQQKFILNDDERIWVAGKGKEVRMSHFQMVDYFPSNQVWKLRGDCTGMARFMGEVMLFTEDTGTLISGSTPDWTLPEKYIYTDLPVNYGCNSHRSIVVGNNAIYWANKDGVYRYRYLPTGHSIPECVSEFEVRSGRRSHTRSVKKCLARITDWTKVFAEFYDHEYRLYFGGRQVMVFDTIGSTWALYEYDKEFGCSMVHDNILYYAGPYLYEMDKTYDPSGSTFEGLSDDGTIIEYKLKSKFFDFGGAADKKSFKELFFSLYSELLAYTIDLNINVDNQHTYLLGEIVNKVSRWGELAFGDKLQSDRTNLNYPVNIRHKGKRYNIQYEMTCKIFNAAFALTSIVLILKSRGLK